ncbi:glycoside hydrolase [Marinitenerispora sediminis]|uniref:Glycoside hydrolase n=1 Tax=Marinitenerispora sediminis TaxID=1931232 RepID=A0A368SZ89_9ACTN|nr:glycoside hydrolase [Marinitenerispora sediminis]RCV48732.1 glycoside hydrolase [Marinitenerispora sediminis]RCV50487.1 glycoside hydrolase [Marinitenerispora sediminis]
MLPSGPAYAEPEPTQEEVEQRIEELTEESSTLVQDYNQAKEDLEAAEKRMTALEEQIGEEDERYEELRERVASFASAAYRSNDPSATTTVLSVEDPSALLEQSADVSYLSERQRAELEEFTGSSERLLQLKEEAEETLDEAEERRDELKDKKDEVEEALAEQEELLAGFEGNPVTGSGDSSGGASYTGSASGSARSALDFAFAQVGKPYIWGGTGPAGYDCSGLTQAAWGSAGVSLPRTTYAQYELPNKVSWDQLQPGDIMFFFPDIGHNGIYAGNGQMVHAPSSGKTIEVVSLSGYWDQQFVGAVRP